MPAKNRIKPYVENGYYHVYNRGVEKRKIFLDDQDYRVFLHLLKTYLSPPKKNALHPLAEVSKFKPVRVRPIPNFHEKITLLAYCLLPNHFHLLLHQQPREGMQKMMRSLCTTYAMYFNRKYERTGSLFQDIYKAAWVGEGDTGDAYLLQLSRYIHLNPRFELTGINPVNWQYSSYQYYLGKKVAQWINPQPILNYFSRLAPKSSDETTDRYQKFVEQLVEHPAGTVGKLAIE